MYRCPGTCTGGACDYVEQTCGNGIIEGNEECDGEHLNDKTCNDFYYPSGTLTCKDCTYDFSGCNKKDNYLMKLLVDGQEKFDLTSQGLPFLKDDGTSVVVSYANQNPFVTFSLYDTDGKLVTSKETPIPERIQQSYYYKLTKMDSEGNIYMFGYNGTYIGMIYKFDKDFNLVKTQKFDKMTSFQAETDTYCEIAKAQYAYETNCKRYEDCLANKTKGTCPSMLKNYATINRCNIMNNTIQEYCKHKDFKISWSYQWTSLLYGEVDDKYVYVTIADNDQFHKSEMFLILDKDLNVIKAKSIVPEKLFPFKTGYTPGIGVVTPVEYEGRISDIRAFDYGIRVQMQQNYGTYTYLWIKKDENGNPLKSYDIYFERQSDNDPPWLLLKPGIMPTRIKNYFPPGKFDKALEKVLENSYNELMSMAIMDIRGEDYLCVTYHKNQQFASGDMRIEVLYPDGTIKTSFDFIIPSCYYPKESARFMCNKDGSIYFTTYRATDPKCI